MSRFPIWLVFAALLFINRSLLADAQNLPVAPSSIENKLIQRDPGTSQDVSVSAPTSLKTNGFDPVRVLIALGIVIGLIFIFRIAARKVLPGTSFIRATPAIKVLSRCPVSPRQNILLVQVGKRLVVVGDSGANLNPLCEITNSEEVTAMLAQVHEATASANPFDLFFRRSRGDFAESEEKETDFDDTHEVHDAEIAGTRREITGLSAKVRELARELGKA